MSNFVVRLKPSEERTDIESLVSYLASETPLSRAEAETKVENGGVVLRTSDPSEAKKLEQTIEVEFDETAEVVWKGPDGESRRVERLGRVKGTVTGGAPPENATLVVTNGDGPPLVETELQSDQSYDLRYPQFDIDGFELVVALESPAGESIATADPIPDPDPVEIVDIELTFGHAAPVTEGEDLLNFMLIKPTAAAAAETGPTLSVEDASTDTLMADLRTAREEGDREGMVDAAASFVESDQYLDDLNSSSLPLETFETEATAANSRADLQHSIEATFEESAREVLGSNRFREARERIASSLTAASLAPGNHEATVDRLEDGMRLLSLIERAADGDEILDTHGEIQRALSRSVTLPDELFPLPTRQVSRPQAAATGDGERALSIATELSQIRSARDELVTSTLGVGPRIGSRVEREHPDERVVSIEDLEQRGEDDDSDDDLSMEREDDDPATDGGSVESVIPSVGEAVSDATLDTLREMDVADAEMRATDAISTLRERELRLGEELQYETLETGSPDAPHSPATLLSDSIELSWEEPIVPPVFFYPSKPHVHPLGVAELQTMRKTLDRYEMGDIAHIENVLEGEFRKRTHRNLERTEEFTSTETERVKEKKRSLETAERFEMETETSKTVEQERAIDTGVQISASYGPSVEMKAHANYNQRTSKTETRESSQRFAREVTEKTVNRIKERVKRKEWEKTIEETEETNIHKIDNAGPNDDDHVIGIYRWLDKYLDAQVFNHGKRMLLEFIVPEPAAFYRYSQATDAAEKVDMDPPKPPKINEGTIEVMENPENPDPDDPGGRIDQLLENDDGLRTLRPTDIHFWNYTFYAQRYGAEVSPPPRKYMIRAKTMTHQTGEPTVLYKSHTVSVPEGYVATEATLVDPHWSTPPATTDEPNTDVVGGGMVIDVAGWDEAEGTVGGLFSDRGELGPIEGQTPDWGKIGYKLTRVKGTAPWSQSVPISIYAERSLGYSVQAHVLCERTEESYEEWQLETYRSIMQAYREKRSEYEERVAAQQVQDGVEISGQNPDRNREIERTELKRQMMAMLNDGPLHPQEIEDETDPTRSPVRITIESIESDADTIRFLEQAFEWTNMTYRFYPYFWAKEGKWAALSRLEDSDPTFASFLRAGAARVVLPVRPGYEYHVPYYMRNNEPYLDEGRPNVNDPEYVSIIDAIKEHQNKLPEDASPVGDPWKVKVPTSLVKLQQDGSLDAGGN